MSMILNHGFHGKENTWWADCTIQFKNNSPEILHDPAAFNCLSEQGSPI